MLTFLKILPILGHLFLPLMSLAHTAEVAFSGTPGVSGQAKKDLTVGIVGAAATGAGLSASETSALQSAAGVMIDAIVAILNGLGIFKKDNTMPTPLPPSLTPPPPTA